MIFLSPYHNILHSIIQTAVLELRDYGIKSVGFVQVWLRPSKMFCSALITYWPFEECM